MARRIGGLCASEVPLDLRIAGVPGTAILWRWKPHKLISSDYESGTRMKAQQEVVIRNPL